MFIGGKSGQHIQKDEKTQLPLPKRQEQKQNVESKSRALCLSPALNNPRAVDSAPKSAFSPDPWAHPDPLPVSGARPCPAQPVRKQWELFVLISPCFSKGPNKALPESLVWPLFISIDWRRPSALVGVR